MKAPEQTAFLETTEKIAKHLVEVPASAFAGRRLRGMIARLRRDWPEAMLSLRRADAIRSNNPDVTVGIVEVLFELGRLISGAQLG